MFDPQKFGPGQVFWPPEAVKSIRSGFSTISVKFVLGHSL